MTRTQAIVFDMDGCLSTPKNCTHTQSASLLRTQGARCQMLICAPM
jgi:hypothetical protein